MGDKVLYQSVVHGTKKKKESIKDEYARAFKQIVDTVAPGFNPRRTKNRTGQDNP